MRYYNYISREVNERIKNSKNSDATLTFRFVHHAIATYLKYAHWHTRLKEGKTL